MSAIIEGGSKTECIKEELWKDKDNDYRHSIGWIKMRERVGSTVGE